MGTPDRVPASLLLGAPAYQQGWQEWMTPAAPAAGANFTRVVPGGYWERVIAVFYVITASAVAGTRDVAWTVRDVNGQRIAMAIADTGIVAGQSWSNSLWPGGNSGTFNAPSTNVAALPDLLLEPGFQVGLEILQVQAGDQLSQIGLLMQRFPSGLTRLGAPL